MNLQEAVISIITEYYDEYDIKNDEGHCEDFLNALQKFLCLRYLDELGFERSDPNFIAFFDEAFKNKDGMIPYNKIKSKYGGIKLIFDDSDDGGFMWDRQDIYIYCWAKVNNIIILYFSKYGQGCDYDASHDLL